MICLASLTIKTTTLPSIPRELRNLKPETRAFLQLMGDMGVRALGTGHLILKTALCDYFLNPRLFDCPDEIIYYRLSKAHRMKPETVEVCLGFAVRNLWDCCDPVKVTRKYFPNEKRLPEPRGNIEAIEILGEVFAKMCREFEKNDVN